MPRNGEDMEENMLLRAAISSQKMAELRRAEGLPGAAGNYLILVEIEKGGDCFELP